MLDRRPAPPLVVALAVLAGTFTAFARQQPTAPDVYLAAFTDHGRGLAAPVDVTNNPGYDNQPAFLSNSRSLLFSSNRVGTQTDIYRYDLKGGELTRLTQTDESEYSPLPTPDGRGFSSVRLEANGAQRLWEYHSNGSPPSLVIDLPQKIGYYAWIDKTHVALALLDARGSTMSLVLADLAAAMTTPPTPIATNVGRSLSRRPGLDELSFVVKPADATKPWMIRTLDLQTRRATDLVATVKGSEDVAWTPSGDLLTAHGTTIFRWSPQQTTWTKLADVPPTLCTNITRLAVSPDGKWLAFVAEPVTKSSR